jgi:RNA polymerase sigma-70 factor, ECF subfamily
MSDSRRYKEFANLVRLHSGQMLGYINALLLNWSDTDDLFQDTCVVLWQKFDQFEPGTNFLAWALRVADNQVLKFRTKQARLRVFTESLRREMMADIAERNAEEAAASLAALSDCMDRLTASDRQMITQCYCDGIPVCQVAVELGRSQQSVHNSLCRIRKWLFACVRRKLNREDSPMSAQRGVFDEEDPS